MLVEVQDRIKSPPHRQQKRRHEQQDKFATSCYHDQVSCIASYRCKSRRMKNRDKQEHVLSVHDLWTNVIAQKEKQMENEILSNIILCKQALQQITNDSLDQVGPSFFKTLRKTIDWYCKRTLQASWLRFKLRSAAVRLDTTKMSAAIVLQSRWRRRLMKKQFASTLLIIVRIQRFYRRRRRLRGLKRIRNEAVTNAKLVREQIVRAYVARCQNKRKQEIQRIQTSDLVRERVIRGHVVRYRRRKQQELEHASAIKCQALVRGFIIKRQIQMEN